MRAFLKIFTVAIASLLITAAQGAQQPLQGPEQSLQGPEQPLPFSHRKHAGEMGLKCATCHRNPDPGEKMGFAPTAICMGCHSEIASDRPAIQKLAAFDREKREIRWVRVYQIPTFVFFSHRAHLAAGSTCVDCHGQVRERDRIYPEVEHTMATCIKCHQAKQASIDCAYCHEKMD